MSEIEGIEQAIKIVKDSLNVMPYSTGMEVVEFTGVLYNVRSRRNRGQVFLQYYLIPL